MGKTGGEEATKYFIQIQNIKSIRQTTIARYVRSVSFEGHLRGGLPPICIDYLSSDMMSILNSRPYMLFNVCKGTSVTHGQSSKLGQDWTLHCTEQRAARKGFTRSSAAWSSGFECILSTATLPVAVIGFFLHASHTEGYIQRQQRRSRLASTQGRVTAIKGPSSSEAPTSELVYITGARGLVARQRPRQRRPC